MQVMCRYCDKPVDLGEIPDDLAYEPMKFTDGMQRRRRLDGLPFEKEACLGFLLTEKLAPACNAHDHCLEQATRRKQEKETAERLVKRAQEWCGLCPPLYQDTKPELLPDQKALKEAMEWNWSDKGLILFGSTGTGKTRMIYLLLKREFLANRFVVVMTHPEFSAKVLSMMGASHYDQENWQGVLRTADILFIDDLGKGRFTDYADRGKHSEEVLFSIFERRCANKLPTIFTCNMSGADLKASMSPDRAEPFVRRLKDFCQTIKAEIRNPNHKTP